jgi:hypothetical protein
MATNRYQPALLGGLFIGILSSLPLISGLNLCCCLWVVVGGLITTYLRQQQLAEPIETSDAVVGGLLAGLIGAILAALGTWVTAMWAASLWQDSFRNAIESNPQVTPEMRDLLLRFTTGRNLVLLQFVVGVPIDAIFSTLGALLGVAFFRKKGTPPAPPPPPPLQV